MSFAEWAPRSASVESLVLDETNPRFADRPSLAVSEEDDNIRALAATADLVDLIEAIARDGYAPTEVLVVVAEGGFNVVIEGNRRLAALKLLLGLSSVSGVALPASHADLPAEIPIVVAPSRDAATPYILRRHTESSVKRWSRLSQARFAWRHRGEYSLSELVDQTGLTRSTLQKHERIGQVDATMPDQMTRLANTDGGLAVLERIVGNSAARASLSLDAGDEPGPEARLKLQSVIDAISVDQARPKADRDFTTRTLNTGEDINAWLGSVLGLGDTSAAGIEDDTAANSQHDEAVAAPNGTPSLTESPAGLSDVSGEVPPREGSHDDQLATLSFPPAPSGRRSAIQESWLSETARLGHLSRFAALVEEMRKLSVNTMPNTSMMMLRSILEIGSAEEQRTRGQTPSGKIDKCVKASLGHFRQTLGVSETSSLETLCSNPVGYLRPLHQIVHNPFSPASTELAESQILVWLPFLESCWGTIRGFHAE